jgi:DNA repair exonuclease SbcCD ATPase subunit
MLGGYKRVEEGIVLDIKELEKLKKDIADLTERKRKLSYEIETAIKEATIKLEAEYEKKKQSLDVTYNSRLSILDVKIKEVEKEWDTIRVKDADIIKREKELKANIELYEKLKQEATAIRDDNTRAEEAIRKDVAAQKQHFAALGEDISKKQAELSEKEKRLEERHIEIEDLDNALLFLKASLERKELSLAEKESKISKAEAAISATRTLVDSALDDAKRLKDEAQKDRESAADFRISSERQKDDLAKAIADVNTQSNNLKQMRDNLNEKETSLREKERVLVLRGRDIDQKVKILQELRKNHEKGA